MSRAHKTIYLKEYRSSHFLIKSVHLHFDLHETQTHVKSILDIVRNPGSTELNAPLQLNGEELVLQKVILDGKMLHKLQYKVDDHFLTITDVPDQFRLETVVQINPKTNTQLSGLYVSGDNFCTHCEAEGFRRITYFLDRPDVLSHFKVGITADPNRYPHLLANGNLIDEERLSNGKRFVLWEDPSLKPCYLFALVAGNLDVIEDVHVTPSGRRIRCFVYVEKGKKDQAGYALQSLKRAMEWDEKTYHREYELDQYMIVAVDDFNAGAMENKGLNIFNTKYVLAKQETATDFDYMNIERVVGHEYFHNWSGNRVTVREWFEITLKEGLTTFREQAFSGDMTSHGLVRINLAHDIRVRQFPEDSGPMSHPIRPKSYIEINNFYTMTVYEKGCEVIRMVQTLLGKPVFSQALEYYFDKYDGQAVTTEEFISAMEESSGVDLSHFRLWYDQSGTPELTIKTTYDAIKKTYTVNIEQKTISTADQKDKKPLHIPFAMSLLNDQGQVIMAPRVLSLRKAQESFTFDNIAESPVPSLLEDFSAPVIVHYPSTEDELKCLIQHSQDSFVRWESQQKFTKKYLLAWIEEYQKKQAFEYQLSFTYLFQSLVHDNDIDPNLLAKLLLLPEMNDLILSMKVADVSAIVAVQSGVVKKLAKALEQDWLNTYQKHTLKGTYVYSTLNMGKRSVRNNALFYLLQANDYYRALACQQLEAADNMTDKMGALVALNYHDSHERQKALEVFYHTYQTETLVMDKWFSIQALAPLPNTLTQVKSLLNHPAFNINNPNKVRALIGAFSQNVPCFHEPSGVGYQFLAEQVLHVDAKNPHVAARLVAPLIQWKRFPPKTQTLMKEALKEIKRAQSLSKDVFEVVGKGLEEA
ncbi:MAG TPA: aminopeptidase N [Coxiellaceae bacterium]|nr:aminopeptidase N [Coxiellaceae bacterium]